MDAQANPTSATDRKLDLKGSVSWVTGALLKEFPTLLFTDSELAMLLLAIPRIGDYSMFEPLPRPAAIEVRLRLQNHTNRF